MTEIRPAFISIANITGPKDKPIKNEVTFVNLNNAVKINLDKKTDKMKVSYITGEDDTFTLNKDFCADDVCKWLKSSESEQVNTSDAKLDYLG